MDTGEEATTTESVVYERYAAAAQRCEGALCCAVEYPANLLAVIPDEILDKDYGCGDPTPYVGPGEVVLDLGSGGGKLCYVLSQIVGVRGRVIGIDCNREMLSLARRHQSTVSQRLGFDNIAFRYGLIQDLRLDLDALSQELAVHPVNDTAGWLTLRNIEERLRREQPLIANDSVDCVVSNCVLNLVRTQDRPALFAEMFRVLRQHGRVAISDIVADEDVPESLQREPHLWSGCVSGAFREDRFLTAFENAGFHGIEIVKRQHVPWRTVAGIEFRSITVAACKGKLGPCLERNQAVIYRGPFQRVRDDDGHVYPRGVRVAVCDKTFQILQRPPYRGQFVAIEPRESIDIEDAQPFDCRPFTIRGARESKGAENRQTTEPAGPSCGEGGTCC